MDNATATPAGLRRNGRVLSIVSALICKKVTQGLTPMPVLATSGGSSHRCSMRKAGEPSESGKPISSNASRRAMSKGCSSIDSSLPITLSAYLLSLLVGKHRMKIGCGVPDKVSTREL